MNITLNSDLSFDLVKWGRNKWYNYLGKINPKKLADILYKEEFKTLINWNNPKDLNEKINWLAFNTDTSNWTRLADKYLAREYVKSKGLEHILTKLYGIWNNPDDIDFNILPYKFVLKCNHDAGSVILVRDKSIINTSKIKSELKKIIANEFGIQTAEPHYIGIKKLIFAEELLEDDNLLSKSIIDYKFWSFHGKTDYCQVCYDRELLSKKRSAIYDVNNWRILKTKMIHNDLCYNKNIPEPFNLKEMIQIVYCLSNEFPECRVDLYECNNKVFFGELTFTAACGRIKNFSKEFLQELGAMVILPQ